jgi:hypothetical protein
MTDRFLTCHLFEAYAQLSLGRSHDLSLGFQQGTPKQPVLLQEVVMLVVVCAATAHLPSPVVLSRQVPIHRVNQFLLEV